jgi:DNA-binding XRE family transcriptional regulator
VRSTTKRRTRLDGEADPWAARLASEVALYDLRRGVRLPHQGPVRRPGSPPRWLAPKLIVTTASTFRAVNPPRPPSASPDHPVDGRRFIAVNVRRLRAQRGLSQEALADRAGLHRTYLGSVERAERNISIDNVCRLAWALGVDVRRLLASRRRRR